MTDLAERVAQAEDVSFAADWLKELIDEHRGTICTDEVWRFPVSEGEEQ